MKHCSKRLLDRVRDAIRLDGYSVCTEEAYADWIKRFTLFHDKRHPREKGMQVVRYAGLYTRNVKRKIAASGSKPPSATIRSNVPAVGVLCNWPKSGNPNEVTYG